MQLELLNFGIAGESRRHSETKALLFIIGSQTDGAIRRGRCNCLNLRTPRQ